jgi:large subunit ribosomal protein L1
MAKRGRKYLEAAAKVNRDKDYSREEAIKLIKATAVTKFDPTVEVHFRLGVDPRHADQQVRDVVVLPHGLGKNVRVLVFADGEDARIAAEAGADYVADDEMIRRIGPISTWLSPCLR